MKKEKDCQVITVTQRQPVNLSIILSKHKLLQQSRPKVISHEVPRRRSPRNTIEAREARAKSRSLRYKELHYGGEDICGKLSQEKQALAALFLSEINRKLCSVVWKQWKWFNKKSLLNERFFEFFRSDTYPTWFITRELLTWIGCDK